MSSAPDTFSLSPLMSILPTVGNVSRLESLVSSLFARFESIDAVRDNVDGAEARARLAHEAAMLRQILDWLSVNPDEESHGE
jgi:hypothetical protein